MLTVLVLVVLILAALLTLPCSRVLCILEIGLDKKVPMNGNNLIRTTITLLVLGSFVLSYFYFYRERDEENQAILVPSKSANDSLLLTSENFNRANDFFTQRTYNLAIEKYNAALLDADSLSEEILIKLQIAKATANAGDNLKAVELLKDIIENPKYISEEEEVKREKVDVVTTLISIYYNTHDKAVADKIFFGKPFDAFIKREDAGNFEIAFRRLEEYASTLSSTPSLLGEIRIAKSYAVVIYDLKTRGNLSEEEKKQIQEYKVIIKSKLTYVDDHMNNPRNYYRNSSDKREILLRYKGVVIGALTAVGEADTDVDDPEEMFKESLALSQTSWSSSATKFTYAAFLAANYGEKRKEDIANLLSDVYAPAVGTEFSWRRWLLNEKTNPTRSQNYVRRLASIDPKFKTFLISLGWEF